MKDNKERICSIAKSQTMPRHSVGTLCLWELPCKAQKHIEGSEDMLLQEHFSFWSFSVWSRDYSWVIHIAVSTMTLVGMSMCMQYRVHQQWQTCKARKDRRPKACSIAFFISAYPHLQSNIIGVSLSEPHTSVAALQDMCVCLSVCCVWPYTENLNWMNGYEGIRTFQICTRACHV